MVQSDNGTITEDHAIRQLNSLLSAAMDKRKDMCAPMRLGTMMREAGLLEVESRMVQMPLNGWPTSKQMFRPDAQRFLPSSPPPPRC